MDKIKLIFSKHKEIIMYLVMGVATTVVNFISYAIFISIININDSIDVILSNSMAWAIAVLFAYFTNKIFVFESKSWKLDVIKSEFILFLSARIVSGIFEIGGPPLLVSLGLNQSLLGVKYMLSKVIVSFVVIVLNYFFSKFLIFKKKKD